MKFCLVIALLLSATLLMAQSPCGAPTPGAPHVCLTWTASVTPPAVTGYNVYRSTTAGGENFGTPLNPTLIPPTQLFFYDTTNALGTTYFYKAVTVGTGGVLSLPTPEVSSTVPMPPNTPGSFGATNN